jgi:uncharacterized membrane protein YeiH
MLYILDLIGVFAFAAYGAHLAQRKSFDIFGIAVCALLSAFGGGALRELFLNRIPAFFLDPVYLLVAMLGVAFAILSYRYFEKMQKLLLVLDAVGLVTFAYLGAYAAHQAGLGMVGIVLFATLSAVGGGIMRDIAIKEVPLVFYEDLYATPAILLGFTYSLLPFFMNRDVGVYTLLATVFLFRLLAIRYKWHLWRPGSA